MSQAKVDRYKEEKANRKKTMRKEKIANRLRKCAVAVAAAVLVVWIGYSAYNMYESSRPVKEAEVNYQSIDTSIKLSTFRFKKNLYIIVGNTGR